MQAIASITILSTGLFLTDWLILTSKQKNEEGRCFCAINITILMQQ